MQQSVFGAGRIGMCNIENVIDECFTILCIGAVSDDLKNHCVSRVFVVSIVIEREFVVDLSEDALGDAVCNLIDKRRAIRRFGRAPVECRSEEGLCVDDKCRSQENCGDGESDFSNDFLRFLQRGHQSVMFVLSRCNHVRFDCIVTHNYTQ